MNQLASPTTASSHACCPTMNRTDRLVDNTHRWMVPGKKKTKAAKVRRRRAFMDLDLQIALNMDL